MDTAAFVSDQHAQTLKDTVNRIFMQAFGAEPCVARAQIPLLSQSVSNTVASLTVRWLRHHNTTSSRQHTFPDSIWLAVWDSLHIRDRLAVAGTCYHFHELALGTPALWRRVDIGHWLFSRPTAYGHSRAFIDWILSLSGDEELEVEVDSENAIGMWLASCLEPHRHRLVVLRLTGWAHSLSFELLLGLGHSLTGEDITMPNLREYTLVAPKGFERVVSLEPWTRSSLHLPALTHLNLCATVRWPRPERSVITPHLVLPKVEFLSICFQSVQDMSTVLAACPRLVRLRARFSRKFRDEITDTSPPAVPKVLGPAVERLRELTIVRAEREEELWCAAAFNHSGCATVVVSAKDEATPACAFFSSLGPRITSMAVTISGNIFSVTMCDDGSRTRVVECLVAKMESILPSILSQIPHAMDVETVTFDSRLLFLVATTQWKLGTTFKHLTMLVSSPQYPFRPNAFNAPKPRFHLPGLRSAHIQGLEPESGQQLVLRSNIVPIIVSGNPRLEHLAIDNLIFEEGGHAADLGVYAQNVTYCGVIAYHDPAPRSIVGAVLGVVQAGVDLYQSVAALVPLSFATSDSDEENDWSAL
ncbi:hypothetical protein EXIGLDRAFT_830139 [Exidia glandulosa HHB12029]|uniref:F-box domain-containing protein n=1 Tax=Exidia glandulosa HHB12029 TaxID=1314781 RepID=A0A165NZH9_EXIGL|nr:hypothetical protein EXIGLDRAFT_830139 [Exidia glandulosa HHB12029]